MTQRHCLDLFQPAARFMDSFVLGNGRLGATMRGAMGSERIDLNLDRLWSGGPLTGQAAPSTAVLLPSLRTAVRHGDAARADDLSRRMQGTGWTQSYQPLSGILFRHAPAEGAQYRRRLDMAAATARHDYHLPPGPVSLTSFVSAPQDVVVVLAQGTGLLPIAQMGLTWDCPHPSQARTWTEGDSLWTAITGRAPADVIPLYVDCADPITYASDRPDADGLVDRGMGFAAVAALVPTAEGAMLVIAAECGFRGSFERPSADVAALAGKAEATLRAALARGPEPLLAEHRADYSALFSQAELHLPGPSSGGTGPGPDDPARAELFWDFGRYLLISSSRPGTEPANLQGIWNPYRRPAWSSNHTTNINTPMNYWPAETTGLGALAEPLVQMVCDLAQAGQTTARQVYGLPGSVCHHNTDLWRFTAAVQGDPVWSNWTGALPWLAMHLWDHWDFGSAGDDFAQGRLLPVLAQAARFHLELLVDDGSGRLIVSPSSSPEHGFLGPEGKAWGVTEGAAMDQELCHALLTRLIALSDRFGQENTLANRARRALARLALPGVDAEGRLMEWHRGLQGADPGHRHLSHLYGLYPGDRIAPGRDRDAVQAALAHRLAHGSGYTGWSMSWVLCLAARAGDPALAQRALGNLMDRLATPALMVLHPYDSLPERIVFQIDGNFGGTAGITELLVQSGAGRITLLPCLPGTWPEGRLSGFRAHGGHRIDADWSQGLLTRATVTIGRPGRLTLDLPAGANYRFDGFHPAIRTETDRLTLTWHAKAGRVYHLTLHPPQAAEKV